MLGARIGIRVTRRMWRHRGSRLAVALAVGVSLLAAPRTASATLAPAAGPVLLGDLTTGADSSYVLDGPEKAGSKYFFSAQAGVDADVDVELYVSSASAGSATKINVRATGSSWPTQITRLPDTELVVFWAENGQECGSCGTRLFVSDGTASGTVPVQPTGFPGASGASRGFYGSGDILVTETKGLVFRAEYDYPSGDAMSYGDSLPYRVTSSGDSYTVEDLVYGFSYIAADPPTIGQMVSSSYGVFAARRDTVVASLTASDGDWELWRINLDAAYPSWSQVGNDLSPDDDGGGTVRPTGFYGQTLGLVDAYLYFEAQPSSGDDAGVSGVYIADVLRGTWRRIWDGTTDTFARAAWVSSSSSEIATTMYWVDALERTSLYSSQIGTAGFTGATASLRLVCSEDITELEVVGATLYYACGGDLYRLAPGPNPSVRLWPSVAPGVTDPEFLTEFGGSLYFAANDGEFHELFMFAGADVGDGVGDPTKVAQINSLGWSQPTDIRATPDRLFVWAFGASDGTATGREPWALDASPLLAVAAGGGGRGTITGTGISCTWNTVTTGDCAERGAGEVVLTATATWGSFGGWTGCDSVDGSQCTVTLSGARRVVAAAFTTGSDWTLKLYPDGYGGGTVTGGPFNCSGLWGASLGGMCTADVSGFVTLTATANAGAVFSGWGWKEPAPCFTRPSATTCTVLMDSSKQVAPYFGSQVSVQGAGTGSGRVAGRGIDCVVKAGATSGDCTTVAVYPGYEEGGFPTLKAIPDWDTAATTQYSTSTLSKWDCPGGTNYDIGDECTTSLSRRTPTITFRKMPTLTVQGSGSGSGTITGASAAIDCSWNGAARSGTCAKASYSSLGTISATPADGSEFAGWTACPGSSTSTAAGGSCTVGTLGGDLTVTAAFGQKHTLTVDAAGARGSVSGAYKAYVGNRISCSWNGASKSGTCSMLSSETVTVTASGNEYYGSTFASWDGCPSPGGTAGEQCTVDLSAGDRSITANFAYKLTVGASGSGSGTIQGTGVDCAWNGSSSSGDCEGVGTTTITLTATPSAGSIFGAWTGTCASNPAPDQCVVAMTQGKTVSASFIRRFTLTVSKAGTGAGAVSGGGGTISCGSTCSALYSSGTSVALSATASGGSSFAGWSGDCSGASCNLSMTKDMSATATFVPTPTVSSYSTTPGGAAVTTGGIGASIYVNGTNFQAPATCTFNGTDAPTCQVLSSTRILTSVPNATSGPIRVTTNTITATGPTFTVGRAVAPTVTSFTPGCGVTGTVITINGTNLAGATAVKVGNQTLSSGWTVVSATQITRAMPSSPTAGTVAVTTAGGTGTSAATLGVCGVPTISGFSPSAQIAGLTVTISGTNFTGISGVSFNGTPAAAYTVVSTTSITATVPAGSTAGAITVTNPAATAASTPFTFTPLLFSATAIAGGSSHSCAIVSDQSLRCWGLNTNGQLGDNTIVQRLTSVQVRNIASTFLTNVSSVATSPTGAFTCAVINAGASGTARCWGQNANGQIGNGVASATNVLLPAPVTTLVGGVAQTLTGVVQVATGTSHACALMSAGTVYCWGLNTSGQLGIGNTTQQTRAVQVLGVGAATTLTGVTRISASGSTTCGLLSTGKVDCWGLNSNGQVGNNTIVNQLRPVVVLAGVGLELSGVTQVAVGATHTCAAVTVTAVVTTKEVRCWGANGSRQLGDGTITQRNVATPVLVALNTKMVGVASIASGTAFTCALFEDGSVKCWGTNASGQLGNNTTTAPTYAVSVLAGASGSGNLAGVTAIACGRAHVAVLAAGKLYAWGLNANGQVGNNTTQNQLTPVAVLGF